MANAPLTKHELDCMGHFSVLQHTMNIRAVYNSYIGSRQSYNKQQ